MRTSWILRIIVILSPVFLLSCGDSGTNADKPAYSRETPADVVEALAYALEHRDSDLYDECLADDYFYEFIEADYKAAGVRPQEPVWFKDEDVAAMDSMFADAHVTDIEAGFELSSGSLEAALTSLRFKVSVEVTVEEDGEEPIIYWAHSSYLYIGFVEDENDSSLWQISGVREELEVEEARPVTTGAVPVSTFGSIKAMFRERTECETDPRSSVECLLRAFESALEYRDIADYMSCLRGDFKFEFDPVDWDAAGVNPSSPWWGRTEDVTAMSALLANSDMVGIMCELEIAGGPWETEEGTQYRLEPYMRFTVDDGGGEIMTYIVYSSWLDIWVTEDSYDPGHWVLKKMAEEVKQPVSGRIPPGPATLTEPATFGRVKAMFR